jgi:hypothetical protein
MGQTSNHFTLRPASPRLAGIFAVGAAIIVLSIAFTFLAGLRVIRIHEQERDKQEDVRHLKTRAAPNRW